MSRCCYSSEYAKLFREGEARRTVRRFLRRGLRGSGRRLADAVAATGVQDATILEVGGGAGDVQAHLLRLGAASSWNVELSPNWEAAAQRLVDEMGLAGRVHRRVGDFLDVVDDLPDADIVVLHRVICCYPDWPAMLGAAISKAERVVAITVPVDAWRTRVPIRIGNRLLALRRQSFRGFVHPPGRMIAALDDAGFRTRVDRRGLIWHMAVAERVPPPRTERDRRHWDSATTSST